MLKFGGGKSSEIKKSDINAIIRRMDLDSDGKITFREFSHGITPEYPGVPTSVTTSFHKRKGGSPLTKNFENNMVSFNQEMKEEVKK